MKTTSTAMQIVQGMYLKKVRFIRTSPDAIYPTPVNLLTKSNVWFDCFGTLRIFL